MYRPFLIAGIIFAGLGVALGAFASHGLKNFTEDEKIIDIFQTGVQYQVFHGLALFCTAIIFEKFPNRFTKWAGYSFIIAIILFSGSLYALSLLKISGNSLTKVVGPITPLGGVFFIGGWLLLALAVLRKGKPYQ